MSFLIPPLKIRAGKTINISGKVTVEGDSTPEITVELLKNDESSTGKMKRTNSDYTFNGIEAGENYKLKFNWDKERYEFVGIYKQDILYSGGGKTVQVAYAVPEGDRDYIFTNKEFLQVIENPSPYTITYGTDGEFKHNGELITETLCEALKTGVGRLNKINTNTALVIKVNNNLTNIDTLVKELKNANNTAMGNEYMYFVKLDSGLDNQKKSKLLGCKNDKVKIINEDIELMKEISAYLNVQRNETGETSIEEQCNVDTENGLITTGLFNASTIVNLKLKPKDTETQPTPTPTPTSTPTENPAPTPTSMPLQNIPDPPYPSGR